MRWNNATKSQVNNTQPWDIKDSSLVSDVINEQYLCYELVSISISKGWKLGLPVLVLVTVVS